MLELNTNPSKKDLKWFGLVLGLFFGVLGCLAWWQFGSWTAAKVLWAIAVALPVVYYAIPPLRRWMFVGWMVLAFPIGWVLSHLLLAGVYYLVITPIGLILRATGRDAVRRKLDPDTETYWEPHRSRTDPSAYFRQF